MELRAAVGPNVWRADGSGMVTAELAWTCNKDREAAITKRHLSAESCGHRTGRPKLDWLDFMTDALTSFGVRNSRRREVKVKVKQSLYRPGQALRVPGG